MAGARGGRFVPFSVGVVADGQCLGIFFYFTGHRREMGHISNCEPPARNSSLYFTDPLVCARFAAMRCAGSRICRDMSGYDGYCPRGALSPHSGHKALGSFKPP